MSKKEYTVTVECTIIKKVEANSESEARNNAIESLNIDNSKPYSTDVELTLTEKIALEQTFELWNYLAASGEDQKYDLDTELSFDPGTYQDNCPLCEYVSETLKIARGVKGCKACPLYDFWNSHHAAKRKDCPCDASPAPFGIWRNAHGKLDRQIEAGKIAAAALIALKKH